MFIVVGKAEMYPATSDIGGKDSSLKPFCVYCCGHSGGGYCHF